MKENTDLVQIRPAFGGNIMAQIVNPNNRPQFCTVRYKIFSAPEKAQNPTGEIVKFEVKNEFLVTSTVIKSVIEKPIESDISDSDVIVAVGRGLKPADIEAAKELAVLLGGNIACTRPLVENGSFDAKHQIGLSGKTVKPKIIITLGISGAVQFAAGMKSSDIIIAVNTDRHAPIFDIAHYCVVGDAGKIIPSLITKIKEARKDV
jgi:electron transfer flavoprotein alpha subunit